MVSIIGLDSSKVQELCDAANQEVDEANKVQIANFLCTVSLFNLDPKSDDIQVYNFAYYINSVFPQGNYAVSGGLKGIEAVEAKAKSFKARMTVIFSFS